MAVITEQMRRVCRQHNRQEIVKISILNKNNLIIGEISGKVVEGSISLDSTSFIRRSGSLKLILDSETFPSQTNYLWITNKAKISVGIWDLLLNEYCFFSLGIFLFKDLNMSYASTDKTISLNLCDKMCQFNGELGGELENDIKIPRDISISQAIKSVVVDLGNESENNVLIEDIINSDTGLSRTLPYTLQKSVGQTLYDAITELVGLYKYTDCFYNTEGQFVCQPTHTLLSDPISETFNPNEDIDFTINSQVTNSFDYIYNYVKITGVSVTPLVSVEDVESTSNPTPVNGSSALKITYNKSLYNSSGTEISDNMDLKSYFNYSGNALNYTNAIFDKDTWSITFTITGENGKILSPKANMLYDNSQMAYINDGYVYSSANGKWEKLLTAYLLTDGINNTTKFELNFNKALYDSNGNPIVSGTSLKSSFTYSGADSSNFVSAIYTIDNGDYYITLTFDSAVTYGVIEINKDGATNSNSLYDSAGLIFDTRSYIMNGETWVLDNANEITTSTTQVMAIATNTDNTSPYSIDNIGKKVYAPSANSSIYTTSQATLKAQYELALHSNLNESVVVSCLKLYYLETNMLIYLFNESMGIDGKYVIQKISYNLGDGTMSLTCNKVYF